MRLDNFVYARECLDAARQRLAPGGGLVLYFAVSIGYIDEHLRMMLTSVFGAPPAVAVFQRFRIYLAGPAFAGVGPRAPQPVDARG